MEARKYKDLKEDILNILDKSMSTKGVQGKLLRKYKDIHWKTVFTRLDKLEQEKIVEKMQLGSIIIWKKR